jgi:reverse gyrase
VATTLDWIHLDKTAGEGNGTAAFHLDVNSTGKNRTGKINVSLTQNAKKKKIVDEIKKAASKASSIYLATDPDREGEAISWHMVQATKLDKDEISIQRVAFHEITKDAGDDVEFLIREKDTNKSWITLKADEAIQMTYELQKFIGGN